MAIINYAAREMTAKIVYYGPGLSGKTTSIQYIHSKISPSNKGKLVSLATETDRTLFFDFFPVDFGKIGGFKIKFNFYTVPGQVFYNTTRKLVLKGADGVVFVADSQHGMQEQNLESLQNLVENLRVHGLDPNTVPFVIQYNKRDLPNPMPLEEMRREINPRSVPDFETSATKGDGIMEAMKGICKLVLDDLQRKQQRASGTTTLSPAAAQAVTQQPAQQAPPPAPPTAPQTASSATSAFAPLGEGETLSSPSPAAAPREMKTPSAPPIAPPLRSPAATIGASAKLGTAATAARPAPPAAPPSPSPVSAVSTAMREQPGPSVERTSIFKVEGKGSLETSVSLPLNLIVDENVEGVRIQVNVSVTYLTHGYGQVKVGEVERSAVGEAAAAQSSPEASKKVGFLGRLFGGG
jgi:signal recognition particle receptor subunit beta